MFSGALRSVWLGAAGAAIAAVCFGLLYLTRAAVVLELDRDLPAFTSGFYPPERAGDQTFAWTADRAVLRLAGLDRSGSWSCVARVRGSRSPAQPQPTVTLSADPLVRTSAVASNDYSEIRLDVPPRPDRNGLTLTLTAAPTFVPGPQDSRELGVQVDRIGCAPVRRWLLPPGNALVPAAIGAGAIAAAMALGGISTVAALAVAGLVSLAQALLFATGGGAFGAYPSRVATSAVVTGGAFVMAVFAPRLVGRSSVRGSARSAIALAAVMMHLQLAALAHPAKQVVDGVFQAHRLEWVMAGRYFFTQPLPDGVSFPYAIGLYVVAAPWTSLTGDHLFVLRAVVIATGSLAALLLYPVVMRWWNDTRAALCVVALGHLVPLTFVVIGNANLPNAFAQSVALMAVAAATGLRAGSRYPWAGLLAVTLLTSLALLSHVSTLVLLLGTLASIAGVLGAFGGREGRRLALAIALVATIATIVAVGLYYRHFPEVYERFASRVTANAEVAPAPADPTTVASTDAEARTRPAALVRPLAWHERILATIRQVLADVGWPLILMAMAGAVVLVMCGARDRLSLVLLGWGAAWAMFLLAGTLTRVDVAYQRYAAEFVGRVNLAGYPVAVLLAARALAWAWRPGAGRYLIASGLVACAWAVGIGVQYWSGWFS